MRTPPPVLTAVIAAAGLGGTAAAAPMAQPNLGPDLAARIPADGALIALRNEGLLVARLTRRGPVESYRDPAFSPDALMWTDRTTLVAMRRTDDGVELRWIVDGKLDPARTVQVRYEDWAQKTDQGPLITLHAGRDGAVWLESCFGYADVDDQGSVCTRTRWMRVDKAPRTVTARTPALRKPRPGFGSLPKRRAPAGYTARLTPPRFKRGDGEKLRGVECTGPSGKATWGPLGDGASTNTLNPARLQWVSERPPLLALEGVAINPVDDRQRAIWLFAPCDPMPLTAAWIGDNMWARRTGDDVGTWTVYLDDQPIAAFAGEELVAAPRSAP